MFIVELLTIAKLCIQPRCSPNDECIKKMWHIYTMKYYSATQKNEIMTFAGKIDRTGEHHVEQDKPISRSQISCFCSFAECRPKTTITIMGHE
jgi:hypothetical protein